MPKITVYPDWWTERPEYKAPPPNFPIVHALRENKKPIGFWPWPDEPKSKKKKKKKKRKK
jgi:hypothetical protein